MTSHQFNGTWTLVERPKYAKTNKHKWIFTRKKDASGKYIKHKAQLVAKGYSQEAGVDFDPDEIFSPVTRPTSVRIVLSLAAMLDYEVLQVDVKTAFLNGSLNEDIFMEQPEGTIEPGSENLVCKLNRSLYGLKQASRCWNMTFDDFVKTAGFVNNESDPCVYLYTKNKRWVSILIYVDDILIVGRSLADALWAKSMLTEKFKLTDIGEAEFYLGVQISRDRKKREIYLSQSHYVEEKLKKFGLDKNRFSKTPMEDNLCFGNINQIAEGHFCNGDEYRSMIGSLLYLVNWTRPDICNAVIVLSQFLKKPKQVHLSAAKRVFQYLSFTKNLRLVLGGTGFKISHLTGFLDADWGNSLTDRKSISGYLFKLGPGLISWRAKRQKSNALSTTEAELMALVLATKEGIWIRRFLRDILQTDYIHMHMFEDNQGAIDLVNNPVHHDKSKHITNQCFWIRDIYTSNSHTHLDYCPTQLQQADIMTKPLGHIRFQFLWGHLKIEPSS
jgi:Reverse transcriptase (RNA-dependent DNA polymerase)